MRSRGTWLSVLVGALLLVGPYLTFVFELDKVSIEPGITLDVVAGAKVGGRTDHPAQGRVLLAAVGVTRGLSPWDAFKGWLDPKTDVHATRDVYGDASATQAREQSAEDMVDSKSVAMIVAGRRIGLEPKGQGVRVTQGFPGLPASSILKAGDVITAVNGTALCLVGDARAALTNGKPGESVALGVRRQGKGAVTVVPVVLGHEPTTGRGIIGVALESLRCQAPFTADVDTGPVIGPSAGLAITLAIVDRLTPGELTGGAAVATTGTIEADGSVGPVGGVKQKTHAVRAAGAKLFLVPAEEYLEAKKHAGQMRVEPVRNLNDALAAIATLPGAIPLPPEASLT